MTLSDRIAVMADGKVLQTDTPEQLYEAPSSREVGAFIGTMNFLRGHIAAVEPEAIVVDADAAGSFRVAGTGGGRAAGDSILVGIRPEKLTVSVERPAEGANAIRGRFAAMSYFGDRSHYFVEVEGVAQRISVASQNDLQHLGSVGQLDYGTEVWLTWAPEGAVILAD
jgi:spermidine/putrescine transport system ATP-binding protein/putrescine transport system ATP-binding protein